MSEAEVPESGSKSAISGRHGGAVLHDRSALEAALSFAGPEDRAAILTQIADDLSRIRTALGAGLLAEQLRAGHELKGLAATVGAMRLADMAALMQRPEQDAVARTALCMAMQALVGQLLQELATLDGNGQSA